MIYLNIKNINKVMDDIKNGYINMVTETEEQTERKNGLMAACNDAYELIVSCGYNNVTFEHIEDVARQELKLKLSKQQ